MANEKTTERENVTGLDDATNRKDAEYDLVANLLAAAEYKNTEIHEAQIKRNGQVMFTVHLRPLSDTDARTARKKATSYKAHPNGAKFGKVEDEFNSAAFSSWLIYLSTTETDRQTIWGNPQLMAKHGLTQAYEGVDILLNIGEKKELFNLVYKISGMDENGNPADDEMDEETFQ